LSPSFLQWPQRLGNQDPQSSAFKRGFFVGKFVVGKEMVLIDGTLKRGRRIHHWLMLGGSAP